LTAAKEEDCALLSMLLVVEVVDSTPIDRSTLVDELNFASFERVCGARGCQEYKIFTNPLQSRIVINNSFNPPTLFRSKKASSAVKGFRQIDVSTLTRRRRLRSEGSLAAKTRRIDLSVLKNKLCS